MARVSALLSAICKCIVEPVSSSSSEVLLPSRCLHRAATALETCSSDSLDAAALAGDFAFFEPLLGAGGFAFLELLGGAAAAGGAFCALVGAAAFAFFALGTGAAATGVATVSATFRFVGLSAFAGVGVFGMVERRSWTPVRTHRGGDTARFQILLYPHRIYLISTRCTDKIRFS